MLADKQLLSEAIHVVSLNPLGMFTTIGEDGVPLSRWMSAAAVDGVHRLYTLTGRDTRKVAQIRLHPEVCWVFSSPLCHDVVTLTGKAQVMDSPVVAQEVWDQLATAARCYSMSSLSDDRNLEFVTLETVVERVELLSPRLRLYVPQSVSLDNV